MSSEYLVSAIMPTRGRQQWAAEAVQMFQAQTYPHRELIVIDDMNERSFPAGLSGENVHYFVEPRYTIGQKRNIACSRACGEIVVHWDSDDIYTPDRIEFQVEMLIAHRERLVTLVGFNEMQFVDAHTGERWDFRQTPPIGVSFCYWRHSWEGEPFSMVNVGEDIAFSSRRRFACCPADGRIVARNHAGNTSPRNTSATAQWRKVA